MLPLYGPDTEDEKEIRAFVQEHNEELRGNWREKQQHDEELLVVMKNALFEARAKGLTKVESIWNAVAYITLVSYDMAVLGELQMFEESEWKRRFHARSAAILIFEALDDLPDLLGKGFRQSTMMLPDGENLLRDVNKAQKKLSRIRNDHSSELKEIRNYMGAHRDHSAYGQLNVVFDLQPSRIFRLSADFDAALNTLGTASQVCLTRSSDNLHLFK